MIIDAHTHIVPEHFPDVGSRKASGRWPRMEHIEGSRANVLYGSSNFRTVQNGCWSVPKRIAEMPAHGVDKQVLSPMPRLLNYDLEVEDAIELTRWINDDIARMIDAAPDRFYGLGAIPLHHVDASIKELRRIKEHGLLGVEVQTNIGGKNLGDAEFRPFLKELESLNLCIFSHAQNPTFEDRFVGEAGANGVGFPVENGLAAAGVLLGRVMVDCPNLRILFSHGAGVFTQLLPRLQNQWQGGGGLKDVLPKSPYEYAQMFYYDDIFFDNRTLRYLIEMVGMSQMVVGSDYPFGSGYRMAHHPDVIFKELGLSAADFEAFSSKNCLRFLGVEK